MKLRPIIFCRITDMNLYRGITDKDRPYNGGSYVTETGYAHEAYNFCPVPEKDNEEICLGFCQLPGYSKNKDVELHIERMPGCKDMKKSEYIEDAIVVFCATPYEESYRGRMGVVGFYKRATVLRYQEYISFADGDQWYSFIANKEDCVLLPRNKRFGNGEWFVPQSGKLGYSFGFGRGNIWYAGDEGSNKEQEYVARMINSIESYDGPNWIYKEM